MVGLNHPSFALGGLDLGDIVSLVERLGRLQGAN